MGIEEWDESLGLSTEDDVGTYWDFIVGKCKDGIGSGVKVAEGPFESLLLCLEEDGKVGEGTLELLDGVKATRCGKGDGERIRAWFREAEW